MTKIEWTNQTWNPLAGCSPVSPGCQNCYAATMARRLEAMGREKYAGTAERRGNVDVFTGRINLDEKALLAPLAWKTPRMVFVNSMSDLFHEEVPDEFIAECFRVMGLASQHIFQVLTKRADRMKQFLQRYWHRKERDPARLGEPYPNVWLGVSCEDQQRADERIPRLIETPAAVRFLSCEPLLGNADLWTWLTPKICGCPASEGCDCFPGKAEIDWVIVGGESGHGARPMHPEWVRSLRDQCRAADVPFFFKQWGEWCPATDIFDAGEHASTRQGLRRRMRVQQLGAVEMLNCGKAAAGRLLDGVVHNEFPQPADGTRSVPATMEKP